MYIIYIYPPFFLENTSGVTQPSSARNKGICVMHAQGTNAAWSWINGKKTLGASGYRVR